MRWSVALACLALTACKPKLDHFSVTPACACRDTPVTMEWEVEHGTPVITPTPTPAGWKKADFDSVGVKPFTVTAKTHFHVDVPGENAADNHALHDQDVDVVDAHVNTWGPTIATADLTRPDAPGGLTCDATTATGAMPDVSSCGAKVKHVRHADGATLKDNVCLISPDGHPYCFEGDGGVDLPTVVVDGTWKLRIPRSSPDVCGGPAHQLTFDVDCGRPR